MPTLQTHKCSTPANRSTGFASWRGMRRPRGARSSRRASPGVCPDSSRSTPTCTVRGWAYFLPEGETAHLGGVVADTREATNGLLDACLESAMRPPRPARVSCFLPVRAEGFEAALRERGFVCEHYRYLSRPISAGNDSAHAESWTAGDLLPAAALLRASYGEEGQHFAPRGTPEEWEQYVRSLVERPGCGVIEPAVTRVVRQRRRSSGPGPGNEDCTRDAAPPTGRRSSVSPPRRSRGATRRRSVPRRRRARRQAGHTARRRQQHQRACALRQDGIHQHVGVHCGDIDGLICGDHDKIASNSRGIGGITVLPSCAVATSKPWPRQSSESSSLALHRRLQ